MNNYLLKLRIPALVLVLLAGSYWANAQRTAVASGNWSNPATWAPLGVPNSTHDVTINDGVNVTVDIANATCASLTIEQGDDFTTFEVSSGMKLTVLGEFSIGRPTDGTSHRTINVDGILEAGSLSMADIFGGSTDDIRVYVNNGGTLDVKGNVTMNGSSTENYLNVYSGALMKLGGSFSGGTPSLSNNSTFEYSGDSPQSISNWGFYNLNLSGTGLKTLPNDRVISGNLEIKVGATLTLGSNDMEIDVNGNRTITINGRLNINGNGRLIESNGGTKTLVLGPTGYLSITDNGNGNGLPTLNAYDFHATSTVEFGSTDGQTISNSPNYGNLITSGSSTKTLQSSGGTITFQGSITIGSGTTLDGNDKTIYVGGDWTSNGNFTSTNTRVRFNGSSMQTISGSNNHSFSRISVEGAGLTLGRAVGMTGDLDLTDGIVYTSDANLLTLGTGSDVNGGNTNASFVNGPLAKQFSSSTGFTFPVGNVNGVRSVSIQTTGGGGTTTFVGRSYSGNPQVAYPGNFADPIKQLSNCEYWTVDRASGGRNATVTLSWDNSICGGSYVTDPSTLIVARFDGSEWVSHGNNGTTSNTITSETVTSFSPFALGTTNSVLNPLPVTFNNVRAYERNSGVQIEWSNMTEKDVIDYTVERSSNGQTFTSINTQSAKSNLDGREDYNAFDASPINGVNYYRIRVRETTGKVVYSKILKVDIGGKQSIFTLYPNPVIGGQVTVGLSAMQGKYSVQIVTSAGQVIHNQSINHSGGNMSQQIQLPRSVKPGVYSMVISGDNYRQSKMFVVQ